MIPPVFHNCAKVYNLLSKAVMIVGSMVIKR